VPWRTETRGGHGPSRLVVLALALLALMLVGAGCGSDDDDGGGGGGGDATAGGGGGGETPTYGKCETQGEFDSVKLETEVPDTLSVGYVTIAPTTWTGDTEDSIDDGFNYCFAANIAHRAGLSKIELQKVDFAQLIVARESGFDIAMDSIYIKPEREEKIDFSIPYGASWSGLVSRTGEEATQADLKDLKFAVTLGSVQQEWLDKELKPNEKYNTYDSTVELFSALQAKQVDAVLIDMSVALPAAAKSNGQFTPVAQVKVGGEVGIVMEQGTPNKEAIDSIVQEMLDSGQIDEMEKKYFFESYGGVDPDKLPDWTEVG
jgi:polar amino acid transport system substrate-binding protein